MTINYWLLITVLAIQIASDLFVRRYYARMENFVQVWAKIQAFQKFNNTWLVLSVIGLIWVSITTKSLFIYLLIFAVSISLPSAIFCSLTGVYPERSRPGYHFYKTRKYPFQSILIEQKHSALKIIGWGQLILFLAVLVFSILLNFR